MKIIVILMRFILKYFLPLQQIIKKHFYEEDIIRLHFVDHPCIQYL